MFYLQYLTCFKMSSFPQVLQVRLSQNYKVKNLVDGVHDWIEDGNLKADVWERLRKHLPLELIPTVSNPKPSSKSSEVEAAGPSGDVTQEPSTSADLVSIPGKCSFAP